MTNAPSGQPVTTVRDFSAGETTLAKARHLARAGALMALSAARSVDTAGGWIRFPYYHHVFDDERRDFARQLTYMAGLGDFISLDDAVAMMASGGPIDGRYVCLSFDDGFKNGFTNAMPVLVDHKAMAAFFLVTGFIDTSVEGDREKLLGFYDSGDLLMEFLTWDDCRKMADAGMTIGSHTINHVHLADLDEDTARAEMKGSKDVIEAELGRACDHFCCPFGRENIDYLPGRDPELAGRVGYKSFLTGHRGAMHQSGNPMNVRRDHLLAGWGNYQIKYFFAS
ncbi:MAG: polysaccharide deacetylase family protein [Rhodospirillales bacterium]